METKQEQKYRPQIVVWETTFNCNMNCLHCGTAAGNVRTKELTTEEALGVCDELARLGCEVVVLSGGEPFVGAGSSRSWPGGLKRTGSNRV